MVGLLPKTSSIEGTSMFRHALRRSTGLNASKTAIFLALTAFALAGATTSWPQAAEKLPSAQEVLEHFVTASGGREALLRHKSATVHGRYQVPASHLDLETTSYSRDGKALQIMTLADGRLDRGGYDGETAWSLGPDGKVDILKGDEVKSVARDADLYYHLHVMDYFKTMDVVGVEEFNGRPCYHLKGINNWGRLNEQFYDEESGLLLGYKFNTAWRGGNGDATQTFEDYKDFGGVLIPTKTVSHDGDALSIFLITSVTYDDVNDSVFALPEAVQKAKAKQGAK
jgi:hypothetical protein